MKLVITFHTTTEAMAMEQACKAEGADGRIIPVPGNISADCGNSAVRKRAEKCRAAGVTDCVNGTAYLQRIGIAEFCRLETLCLNFKHADIRSCIITRNYGVVACAVLKLDNSFNTGVGNNVGTGDDIGVFTRFVLTHYDARTLCVKAVALVNHNRNVYVCNFFVNFLGGKRGAVVLACICRRFFNFKLRRIFVNCI